MFSFYANPKAFMNLTNRIFPWSFLLTFMFLGFGLYWSFFVAPSDYQQGDAYRIMFVHVPASWMALGVYTFMAASSLVFLVWRHTLASLLAQSAAPIGACFTAISLITGSIWGKPMWGTWWVWDARLTSVLILFFLYVGYMALTEAYEESQSGEKVSAYLCLVGWLNIPLIKFSVEWWNTLHQPASFLRNGASSIHSSMLAPLFLMFAAYVMYFITVLIMRVRGTVDARRLLVLRFNKRDGIE